MKEQVASSPTYDLFSKLKQVSPELYALDRKPLIPKEFEFPLEKFASMISQQFQTEVSIHIDEGLWSSFDDLEKERSSTHLQLVGCSIFGIKEPFSFLFPKESMTHVLEVLLHEENHIQNQPQEFCTAFEAFFLASLVSKAKECTGWKNMAIQLIDQETLLPCTGFFTYRCTVTFGTFSFPLIIALPPAFLDGLHTIPKTKEFGEDSWVSSLPIIPISIEAARTHLSLNLVQELRPGDLLFVDFPFFIPGSERARVILTYRGIPLFRAKVKNGVLKLLEMSNNQQMFQPLAPRREGNMAQNKPNIADKSTPTKNQDDELLEEQEVSTSNEKHVVQTSPDSQPLPLDELPLVVVVQLKELSMTLEQLKALQVGNLLDLDIHPEQTSVQLIIQGHSIAEGDLIVIGDKLGVRIRTIGTRPS